MGQMMSGIQVDADKSGIFCVTNFRSLCQGSRI